jgi:hypothetical protein
VGFLPATFVKSSTVICLMGSVTANAPLPLFCSFPVLTNTVGFPQLPLFSSFLTVVGDSYALLPKKSGLIIGSLVLSLLVYLFSVPFIFNFN